MMREWRKTVYTIENALNYSYFGAAARFIVLPRRRDRKILKFYSQMRQMKQNLYSNEKKYRGIINIVAHYSFNN